MLVTAGDKWGGPGAQSHPNEPRPGPGGSCVQITDRSHPLVRVISWEFSMRNMLAAFLLLSSPLASADVINVEFKFTPYTGDLKQDLVHG